MLFGGARVPKHHLRVEAYGTVDELNSFIGLLAAQRPKADTIAALQRIQHELFNLGALLATPQEKQEHLSITFGADAVSRLEQSVDDMTQKLPPLKHFILPGGGVAAAHAHVARTVCRRAERLTSRLSELEELPAQALTYLNRLSDYLFVLARYLNWENGGEELRWKAGD